ncbi:MAG: endonuclease/exonuclease/phosphatase family protein [Akkermansiaceae bacterium]
MNIGLWNIDHPETESGRKREQQRFDSIISYLEQADCDTYIITEANAAMNLDGYSCELSNESPFKSSRRYYGAPNVYHQVAIYSRLPLTRYEAAEPINSLQVILGTLDQPLLIYGNVVTIKDQWSKTSDLTYADRLNQQIEAIRSLSHKHTLVAGDFNLRLGWPQKFGAHKRIKEEIASEGWIWPTEQRDDTVQHILHTDDLNVSISFDFSVKYSKTRSLGLSDHPFVEISASPINA